ncbi:hypothetical protein [Tropicimonas sp. S265A]|uniref:hypothetical protein n=1 Tax=Tropicimonas sp. S265A TaxID=3415134 RepID=UPI003C7C355D
MKKFALIFAGALVLSACDTPGPSEPTAADPLVGKSLVGADGTTFLFNADGTVGGTLGGEAIAGTYEASATEICSTYTAPDRLTGREFCSTPTMSDGAVVFNRRDGSRSQPYVIGG